MARKPPKYALHKPSGHARVRIKGKDIYLGEYNSPESHEEYKRLLAKYFLGNLDVKHDSLSIARIAIMYVEYARSYYRKDGVQTSEIHAIQMALKPLVRLFGKEKIHAFGPRKLKLVREEMIKSDLARTTINHAIHRINRMFRWASENEYADSSVYQACKTITGLRRGRCEARESEPVIPVPIADIEAIELFVSRPIWSMIQLQLCTGMRPGEACIIRACDIDVSGPVWEYTPKSHKTEHHDRQRLIFIGPRGQEILRPYLAVRKDDEYLFRPEDAEKVRNELRKASRKSAMTPSQSLRTPKESPMRKPGERYQRTSYTRAIARACTLAKVPVWAPNQLRHNAATELRKIHGLEGTRTVLGHSSTDMTEVYAEIDYDKARKIMLASG
jgi:integrase